MVATLKGEKNPDGFTYDPSSKLVFVMNHDGGDSTVIDPVAKKVVATIPVGGDLEFPVSDGMGKVFVNVEDKNQIAVIDVASKKGGLRTMNISRHFIRRQDHPARRCPSL